MAIGANIKKRRIELGMTQRDLCKKMGYSNHSTIARIESGSIDLPQSKIVQFASALDTTPSYLMGWDEEEVLRQAAMDAIILKEINKDEDLKELIQMYLALPEGKKKTIKRMVEDYYNDFA